MPLRANKKRHARTRVVDELRRELMGPSDLHETIDEEYPTGRYIVGRLAPSPSEDRDTDAQMDSTENDTLGAGEDDPESGADEPSVPLTLGFHPSSMGVSFLVESNTKELCAEVVWGDYKRERVDGKAVWKRYPRTVHVTGIPVGRSGSLLTIPLSGREAPGSVSVTGDEDPEVALQGVVRSFGEYRAVSLFVVNRRAKGLLQDRTKDERWLFQVRLSVSAPGEEPVFVSKDVNEDMSWANPDRDEDAVSDRLLYRHAREFATGHGVAAGWVVDQAVADRASRVYTDFIPEHEVPQFLPGLKESGAVLDMKELAGVGSDESLAELMAPLVDAYEDWVDGLEAVVAQRSFGGDDQGEAAAGRNIDSCREVVRRLRSGLELVRTDTCVAEAFRFANRVMWDQRVHSLWAARNQASGRVSGHVREFDEPRNRTWRPFQLAFLLLNLSSIREERGEDRRTVDLLWFPTGGGKTEAYLGLAAFVLALRRLLGGRNGMQAEGGVSIIMRYTLRLLTVQQFQRAAAMIAACELIRRGDPKRWGTEAFQIGLWVGSTTTPNSFADSRRAIEDINEGKRPSRGSPIQLVSCPRCGESLVDERGRPKKGSYLLDAKRLRTLVLCPNASSCEFSGSRGQLEGFPAVMVDEEIYRTCPSLVIATVDKFARMPFKGPTQALFGKRDRHSRKYGHLTEGHGDRVEGRKISDGQEVASLLPPELIIQDELHLISGPLGTMVGLYESAVEFLASYTATNGPRIRPKIIASTATIRRAREQVQQLYGRKLSIFPPAGLSARDSFFAGEVEIDPTDDSRSGRLYVGVSAPGTSAKTLLVRVYSVLLAAAQREIEDDPVAADPFATLVGYFNSLRALGGAKRLVEDDVSLVRLSYLANRRGLAFRYRPEVEELTSRIDSWRIPGLLKKLEREFPRRKSDWPVDVLLATNMISVGVDIDRLGLMVVAGQPKTTAEYIQSTSRVGRRHPGLVVMMYNWLGPRDLSHYERFKSYHSALYRYVEAMSVTPFSSRALDRGLGAVFASICRLASPGLAQEGGAAAFPSVGADTDAIIENLVGRAEELVGDDGAALVRARLEALRKEWAAVSTDSLRYSWLNSSRRPPENTAVLLRTAGTENEGVWLTPGSLREVEPTAAFFLDENEA